jgi:hypothetical protein
MGQILIGDSQPLECPLRVKSGRSASLGPCPLYPQKQTLVEHVGMSALCQKQTLCVSLISDKSSSGRTSFTVAIMHMSKATSGTRHEW